jgi:hypothetical protein
MTKARTIADLGTGFVNISDSGTAGTKVASGTTGQRGSTAGQIRFNTTTGLAEYYTGTEFKIIDAPPTVTVVSPTNVESATAGNETFTITGTSFQSGATVKFIGNDATEITASTTTVTNSTTISAVIARSSFVNAKEPYDVKVINASGLSGILDNQINVDNAPAWNTSSGSIYTGTDLDAVSISVSATDPEGDTVSYSVQSGSLPSGLSLNSSTGAITGTPNDVASNTTSTFTLRATANGKTADRQFTITINNPVITTFSYTGSEQTFTVPAGVTSFKAYMWGAAGGAGYEYTGGGGGARGYSSGGSGGYTSGTISTSPSTVYKIIVGQGGYGQDVVNTTTGTAFGGGGRGNVISHAGAGGTGGGLSGIFLTSFTHANSVLIAGGGAGGEASTPDNANVAGNGGGNTGNDGGLNTSSLQLANGNGKGGTQSAGGNAGASDTGTPTSGSALQGGTGGHMSSGGGGGYYGGGGGGHTSSHGSSGSGGGSGYIGHNSVSNGVTTASANGTVTGTHNPPETSSTYYSAGIGVGATQADGGNGKLVIVY